MTWVYDDGGRAEYFRADKVGDCAARAIAIATGKDYREVYDALAKLCQRRSGKKSARDGVDKRDIAKYLEEIGWVWHSTMGIGTGCKMHLTKDELPSGTLIARVSKHITCVVDGVVHDTHDPSRGGTRCVYGYWTKGCDMEP